MFDLLVYKAVYNFYFVSVYDILLRISEVINRFINRYGDK